MMSAKGLASEHEVIATQKRTGIFDALHSDEFHTGGRLQKRLPNCTANHRILGIGVHVLQFVRERTHKSDTSQFPSNRF
jgi:hypothetical protein